MEELGIWTRKNGTKAQVISTTWKLLKDACAWLSPLDVLMYVLQDKVRTLVFFKPPESESKEQPELKSCVTQWFQLLSLSFLMRNMGEAEFGTVSIYWDVTVN